MISISSGERLRAARRIENVRSELGVEADAEDLDSAGSEEGHHALERVSNFRDGAVGQNTVFFSSQDGSDLGLLYGSWAVELVGTNATINQRLDIVVEAWVSEALLQQLK